MEETESEKEGNKSLLVLVLRLALVMRLRSSKSHLWLNNTAAFVCRKKAFFLQFWLHQKFFICKKLLSSLFPLLPSISFASSFTCYWRWKVTDSQRNGGQHSEIHLHFYGSLCGFCPEFPGQLWGAELNVRSVISAPDSVWRSSLKKNFVCILQSICIWRNGGRDQ